MAVPAAVFSITVAAAPAHAATIGVGTISDEIVVNGACSLREAIRTVNGLPNGDCAAAEAGSNTIMLASATYALSLAGGGDNTGATGDLDVGGTTTSLTITGAGPGATVIDATGLGDRIIDVLAGAPAVTIGNVALTGGRAPAGAQGAPGGHGANGGAINSVRPLTVETAVITGNQAGAGGAGSNSPGTAGGAGGTGGGIYMGGASLAVTNSAITNNRAGNGGAGGLGTHPDSNGSTGGSGGAGGLGGDGGGISSGSTMLSRTTLAGNAAGSGGNGGAGGEGGGGASGGPAGNGGNAGWGGGIAVAFATVQVTNSTVAANNSGSGGSGGRGGNGGSGNSSVGPGGKGGNGGAAGSGGGIAQSGFGGPGATLLHLTVAGNSLGTIGSAGSGGFGDSSGTSNGAPGTAGAAGTGGGINENGAETTVQNSIVAQNSGGNCAAAGNGITPGTITGVGSSNFVFGDSTCPGSVSDPKLGALQDNGGTGPTMALMPGSPAIQAVPASGAGCAATDERGVARPQGIACDAGGYEVAPPTATTDAASAIGSTGATVNGTVTPNGSGSVYFEFGLTDGYGSKTATQTVAAVSARAVAASVGALSPSTTYHYRVVTTTADGGTAKGEDKTFTALAAEVAGGTAPGGGLGASGGGPGSGLGSGSVLAVLTGLKLSPATFAAAPRGSSVQAAAKRAVGTKVSFKVNVAGTITFRVVKLLPGRRPSGARCVAPTKKNRSAKKCTRLVPVKGSFARAGSAGVNSFRFTGRLRRKALTPAQYRLVATPPGGKAVSAAFRVVK